MVGFKSFFIKIGNFTKRCDNGVWGMTMTVGHGGVVSVCPTVEDPVAHAAPAPLAVVAAGAWLQLTAQLTMVAAGRQCRALVSRSDLVTVAFFLQLLEKACSLAHLRGLGSGMLGPGLLGSELLGSGLLGSGLLEYGLLVLC